MAFATPLRTIEELHGGQDLNRITYAYLYLYTLLVISSHLIDRLPLALTPLSLRLTWTRLTRLTRLTGRTTCVNTIKIVNMKYRGLSMNYASLGLDMKIDMGLEVFVS